MIQLKNIHKSYIVGKNDIVALKDISLTIPTGNIFGVIGHSGAGKSTLIRCLNLLERPTSGEVWLDDICLTALNSRELMHIRRKIGMIFQHFNLLSSQTVFNNIAFPLHLENLSKQKISNRVNELLELTGLTEHAHKYPAQLSGGQKQRVGIARALSSEPRVLLCDEATSALDPQTTQSILQLLVDINQKLNLTIVLITHEMEVIRKVCHQVAVIHDSVIIEEGAVEEVFLHPKHQVTQGFIMDANHHDELKNHLQNSDDPSQHYYQITYSGDETYQPHLSDIVHQAGVQFSILSGKISYIRDLPYGQLIVGIKAENGTIDKALALFKERNISATPIKF